MALLLLKTRAGGSCCCCIRYVNVAPSHSLPLFSRSCSDRKRTRPRTIFFLDLFFIKVALLRKVEKLDLCKKRVRINCDAPTSEEHRRECFRLSYIIDHFSFLKRLADHRGLIVKFALPANLSLSLSVFSPGVKLYGVACAVPIFFFFFFSPLSTRRLLQVYTVVRD